MAERSATIRPRLSVRVWVDIAVLTILSSIGLLGFATSFGDLSYLVAGFGGLLVGTGSALVAAYFKFDALLTTLVVVVAYFLFGSLFAMPAQAILGFLPSLETLSGLGVGAVFGWADIVTLTTPVAAPDYIGVLPYIATWLVGIVSATLAARWFVSRGRTAPRSLVALLGPIAIYVTSVLTGTEVPYFAALRGIGFAMIALVWMSWRVASSQGLNATASRAILRRRILGVAGVALAAIVIGGTLGFAAAPPQSSRFVLRDNIQPPFDPLQYPSPLSGFRKYTKDSFKNPDAVLFTITGLPAGQRVRIATMDAYDGRLWNVTGPETYADSSGAFALIGHRTQPASLLTKGGRTTIDVKVGDYTGVWLPTVGYARDIAFDPSVGLSSTSLRYNSDTGIAVVIGGLKKGMHYEVQADTQKVPTDDELKTVPVANVELPAVSKVPDVVASKATQLAGDAATPIQQLRAIEQALSTEGYLSHGTASNQPPSSAGHGADRMRSLLTANQWIGDDEQFASAFTLMARSLGYPARVVMGFAPKENSGSGAIEVKGSDVKAWVEVAFDGVGWIPFDPTPPEFKDIPPDTTTKPKTEPQPQVRQPPRTDAKQDDLLSPVDLKKADDKAAGFVIPGWVWNVVAGIGIPAAIYFVPLLLIGYLKRRRRARRKRAETSDRRAAGAWDELVDTYAELGYAAPRKATRLQLALGFESQFRDEVAARELERASADDRAAAKAARDAAKATANSSLTRTDDRLTSALEATVMRARGVAAWRPGVNDDRAPLPAIPGLRDFAVSADRAVFSGADLDDGQVDDLWTGALEAEQAAQRSVSWFRRQLSKFRIRAGRDVTDDLSARLTAAVPTSMRGAFTR